MSSKNSQQQKKDQQAASANQQNEDNSVSATPEIIAANLGNYTRTGFIIFKYFNKKCIFLLCFDKCDIVNTNNFSFVINFNVLCIN